MATVEIPTPLRPLTGNEAQVEIEGSTVGEVLSALCDRFPEVRSRLYDDAGQLRRFVNVFVDGDDIRHGDGEGTTLADGARIAIVPAIAGGAGILLRQRI